MNICTDIYVVIGLLLITLFTDAHSQPINASCWRSDLGHSIDRARYEVEQAMDASISVDNCGLTAQKSVCTNIFNSVKTASDHIMSVDRWTSSNCISCRLDDALAIAQKIEQVARVMSGKGDQRFIKYTQFPVFTIKNRMKFYCPDLTGRWYVDHDPQTTIEIEFDFDHGKFIAKARRGSTIQSLMISVHGPNQLFIDDLGQNGLYYEIGSLLDWGSFNWVRSNTADYLGVIGGSWENHGNIVTIVQKSFGQYDMYIEYRNDESEDDQNFLPNPGEKWGEIQTTDGTNYTGFIYTGEWAAPRVNFYGILERDILYISGKPDIERKTSNMMTRL